jgi:hypothetical protein
MTRFRPTLIVTRLVVMRNSFAAYDELFHAGVNIIRGENSSGKSTVLNLIFYGLGGDLKDWSDAARLCTRVYLEVSLNGKSATLSREISSERRQPMEIFGGDYQASLQAQRGEWMRYPYTRSPSQESFSQALFRLLELPEVANEISGNVTMHQYLRLLYADQLSSVEHLFRDEDFDSPALRETVGRLLCGVYDGTYYENELRIKGLEREFDDLSGRLRSLYEVVGIENVGLNMDWISGRREVLAQEQLTLQAEVEKAERAVYTMGDGEELSLNAQDNAFSLVQEFQAKLTIVRADREATSLDASDSAGFIAGLEAKLAALSDSKMVMSNLGEVEFQVCPACYAKIQASKESGLTCHLCHSPYDEDKAKGRIVGIINDIAIQLRQSRLLQEQREQKLRNLDKALQTLNAQWKAASSKLAETQRMPSTAARQKVRELQRKLGYNDREREDLEQKAKLIAQIEEFQHRKAILNAEITLLKERNEALRKTNAEKLSTAYAAIEEEVKELLIHDLRRQDSFEDPKRIDFGFGRDRITVDGISYFSASSRVILRSSFIVALLSAATKHEFFRHPRFCMIDTIEDKGMEVPRSHNFQLQIARISAESKVDHQIIFATAMIEPSLDEDTVTIGKYSTGDDPTLAVAK